MFIDHQLVDDFLTVGIIASTLGSAYLAHRLLKRDAAEKAVVQQGRRLDRHAVEIRHTQKQTNVRPFYPDSENEL